MHCGEVKIKCYRLFFFAYLSLKLCPLLFISLYVRLSNPHSLSLPEFLPLDTFLFSFNLVSPLLCSSLSLSVLPTFSFCFPYFYSMILALSLPPLLSLSVFLTPSFCSSHILFLFSLLFLYDFRPLSLPPLLSLSVFLTPSFCSSHILFLFSLLFLYDFRPLSLPPLLSLSSFLHPNLFMSRLIPFQLFSSLNFFLFFFAITTLFFSISLLLYFSLSPSVFLFHP